MPLRSVTAAFLRKVPSYDTTVSRMMVTLERNLMKQIPISSYTLRLEPESDGNTIYDITSSLDHDFGGKIIFINNLSSHRLAHSLQKHSANTRDSWGTLKTRSAEGSGPHKGPPRILSVNIRRPGRCKLS
ncbi:hypothetical protein EVAR_30996_1 [Eumeta japonica]|uniref:Uncharacterized protein n=1 Tax=Eumeta variegata TaxID=151549 RepID=A0A4C1WA10_EUMVA|nr:hypothetical protein EVAR_30996_1 [Eumeta japonica]